jgi:hypothetical protein
MKIVKKVTSIPQIHSLYRASVYIGPLLSMFEYIKVTLFHMTQGVSWLLWVVFASMSIGWVVYGMIRRDMAVVVNNFVNFVICAGLVYQLISLA